MRHYVYVRLRLLTSYYCPNFDGLNTNSESADRFCSAAVLDDVDGMVAATAKAAAVMEVLAMFVVALELVVEKVVVVAVVVVVVVGLTSSVPGSNTLLPML